MNSRKRVSIYSVFFAVLLLFTTQQSVFSWGKEGHVYINKVAVQKIPKTLPSFFVQGVEEIVYLGPEPDRWRQASEYTLKNAQEPDHYINLEKIRDIGEIPKGRYTFYKQLYEKRALAANNKDDWLPESIGLLPYITIEVYDRLKVAFREYRALQESGQSTASVERVIVFYAGWLSHYVADGANPLHVTIHYRGWVGDNPHGYTTERNIHSDFEIRFVSQNITIQGFADLVNAPIQLANPFDDFMKFLRESNKQVERVYQLYKARGFDGNGSKDALEFTNKRLAAGCQMLLNLWYTAWVESGKSDQ